MLHPLSPFGAQSPTILVRGSRSVCHNASMNGDVNAFPTMLYHLLQLAGSRQRTGELECSLSILVEYKKYDCSASILSFYLFATMSGCSSEQQSFSVPATLPPGEFSRSEQATTKLPVLFSVSAVVFVSPSSGHTLVSWIRA